MRAVAVLLLAPGLACAQNWNDILRKGADAAMQEIKKQQAQKPAPPPKPAAPSPQPAESSFVPPSATTRFGDGERCFSRQVDEEQSKPGCPLRKVVDGAELLSGPPRESYPVRLTDFTSTRIIMANPYFSLDAGFFWNIGAMTCDADGSIRLNATAHQKKDGRSYAVGLWRIAPDGQITAYAVKPFMGDTRGYPYCNVPLQKSRVDAESLKALAPTRDGSLLTASNASILRIQPGGMVSRFAGHDVCTAPGEKGDGYVDGTLDEARFKGIASMLEDPQGNVWVGENSNRALRKISGGRVTTVLKPEQVYRLDDPLNAILFHHLAWDAVRSELVAAGMQLDDPRGGRDYVSTVWRITPEGATRRVFLARALHPGRGAHPGTLHSMTVDARGDILVSVTPEDDLADGSTQIWRIDGADRLSLVSGMRRAPTRVMHSDGPAREAIINQPYRMCMDAQGTVFLGEKNLIRRMAPDGRVTTWVY